VSERTTRNNQFPVLTSSKSGLFLQSDYFNKQVASKDDTGYKIIKRGQFTYRAMSDTGEFFPNILDCVDIGIVSPAYPVFKISNGKKILPDYLKYFFKSNGFQRSISSFAQGSTRTSIKFNKLKTVEIEQLDIDQQKAICRTLQKVETIIHQKESELQKFDDLIKAQFVEMFGKENKTLLISDICDFCSRGRTPRYVPSSTLKVINQACIYWDGFKFENIKYNDESYSGDRILNENDILICSTGTGTLGRCNVFKRPDDNRYMADSHVTILRLNSKILPEVFKTWFERPKTQDLLYSNCVSGSTNQIELSKTKLKEMQIIVPPIQSQKQFTTFVSQVDKSKFVILCDIFSMRNLYIRLINDCITHSSINLRVP